MREIYTPGQEAPDIEGKPRPADMLHLFDIDPLSLHNLFRDFDMAMETPEKRRRNFRLIHEGGTGMSNKFTRSRIQEIITGAGLDVRTASELTGRIINAMTAALAAGEAIELRGFGSLELKERKAYKARNPRTGESLTAPPRAVPPGICRLSFC